MMAKVFRFDTQTFDGKNVYRQMHFVTESEEFDFTYDSVSGFFQMHVFTSDGEVQFYPNVISLDIL